MKPISGKELIRILENAGWQVIRIHGSHHILMKSGHTERISVPVHGNQPLKIGLLKHLLKIAGIDVSEV